MDRLSISSLVLILTLSVSHINQIIVMTIWRAYFSLRVRWDS